MKARVFALYLPQFHPIPENDQWWGKGFTEWTNVGKAKPLFKGHYQPHVPADLGYYDLRLAETRKAQADLAHQYGVEGFIYWHYWFGNGKRLLEQPINEVVNSGDPDFPFAFAWANETWKGFAHGLKNRNILIEQLYPGEQDYIDHFYAILPALKDKRYIRVNGKNLFMIYKPHQLPDPEKFIELWQRLARENGLKGFHFVAHHQSVKEHNGKSEMQSMNEMLAKGFDSVNFVRVFGLLDKQTIYTKILSKVNSILRGVPRAYSYKKFAKYFSNENDSNENVIPSLIPNWDHSPRSGKEAVVMVDSTPALFEAHVADVIDKIKEKPADKKIVIIKSWNEWAEGNYMEPDLKWGHSYLQALYRQIK